MGLLNDLEAQPERQIPAQPSSPPRWRQPLPRLNDLEARPERQIPAQLLTVLQQALDD